MELEGLSSSDDASRIPSHQALNYDQEDPSNWDLGSFFDLMMIRRWSLHSTLLEFYKFCKVMVKAHTLCLVTWVLDHRKSWKVDPKRKTHFLTGFCYHEGISLAVGKRFSPSGKYAYNKKNILISPTNWPLNEVRVQVFEGSREREV